MTYTDGLSDLHEEIKVLEKWLNQSLGEKKLFSKISTFKIRMSCMLLQKKSRLLLKKENCDGT